MIDIALPRVHVVGMGEVGQRLAGALGRAGVATHPVTRTRGWDEARDDGDGLYLVCVREESLAGVLEALHNVSSDRLVLIQNGWGAFLESAVHLDWSRVSDAKALDFRNGAVVALAAEHGLSAPVNSDLLQKYGAMCATTNDRDVMS